MTLPQTTNEVARIVDSILSKPDLVRRALTIKPIAVRRSGRRARRAAFYNRCRMCRVLTRIALQAYADQSDDTQERFRNALVYGTSHPEMYR